MAIQAPGRAVLLPPINANLGLEKAYRAKLDRLIDEMNKSVAYWVAVTYRNNPSDIAQDASPAKTLQAMIRKLKRRWLKRFDEGAQELAAYFATQSKDRVDGSLQVILRKAGFSVKLQMTPAMNNAYQAVIGEQVALIKSIPSEYFTQIEGMVMRSVAKGGDLHTLSKDLHERYDITKRRAALIARDQNRKSNATIQRTRFLELGVTEAIWQHSAGGKVPRPSHVAFNGKRYDVRKGAYIDGEWIQPGEPINCRCNSRAVIPGLKYD